VSVRTRAYRKGVLDAEDFPLDDLSEHLAEPDTHVWVDLHRPDEAVLGTLASELGLHPLAVEDALEPHQRSKIDRYATHAFLAAHAVTLDIDAPALKTVEIDAFIGESWFVTVRSDDSFDMGPVVERWDRAPDMIAAGVGYMVHGLIDEIVDGYFTAIEQFDDYYDDIGDAIFSDHPLSPEDQRNWFDMRRILSKFYRLVAPLREALGALVHRQLDVVKPEIQPYFQDLYDHLIVVSESADALRDLATSLVEANLSLRDYRQNQVMKKVTSWAAIVAVPTLITGYYGMNVPYPGFGHTSGVWVSTVLMVVLAVALYVVFKRRDWL
jgi:magnesium transporter